uniref:non-specific serine/threonine protein kinase n=1 Tax=Meloidogyne enterolobii TaxID=390850 RepID=A0A6V7VBX9_MELEN|nr:unnamed protein product [Meloidogyne enterolobii]
MMNFAKYSKSPEICGTNQISQKADIWAFGLMVYELFNKKWSKYVSDVYPTMKRYRSSTDYNTRLDRVIKACVQHNPTDRPKMKEIVQFHNDEIEYFGYELLEMERLKNERLEEEKRKKVERRRKRRNRFFCGLC